MKLFPELTVTISLISLFVVTERTLFWQEVEAKKTEVQMHIQNLTQRGWATNIESKKKFKKANLFLRQNIRVSIPYIRNYLKTNGRHAHPVMIWASTEPISFKNFVSSLPIKEQKQYISDLPFSREVANANIQRITDKECTFVHRSLDWLSLCFLDRKCGREEYSILGALLENREIICKKKSTAVAEELKTVWAIAVHLFGR